MKKKNLFITLVFALGILTASESCKNKKKADTTQNTNTTTEAPVVVNTDTQLRTSVDALVREYNGVQAEVNDGVIVLRGSIKKDDLQKLVQKIQELRPKKVDNQLIIKIN